MTISEVFWIGPPPNSELDPLRRKLAATSGTVVSGELTGTGTLKPGDFVM